MTTKFVQTQAVKLYKGMSSTDTVAIIKPYPLDIQTLKKLTYNDFGDNPTITIDPKIQGYEEICFFSGIIDNGNDTASLTGLTRNLIGQSLYTTSGTGKQHGSDAIVVFSNNPQRYSKLMQTSGNNTFSNINTFSQKPIVPIPTTNTQIATKKYADDNITLLGYGPKSPGTMANRDVGSAPWINPNNAKVNDGIYSTCTMDGLDMSDSLFASNFGFSIPNGATIIGILVEVKAKCNTGSDGVQVFLNNGTLSDIGPIESTVTTSEQYLTFGGSSELWGRTDWTPALINSSSFGAGFQDWNDASTKIISVDHIRITVYIYNHTIPDASTSVKGLTELSTAPVSGTNPIEVGDNDSRIPTQGENDAMAGSYVTPSSSNKFVTETDTVLTNNMILTTNQSIDGIKTFSSIPVSSAGVPTTDNQLATKGYIDSL